MADIVMPQKIWNDDASTLIKYREYNRGKWSLSLHGKESDSDIG